MNATFNCTEIYTRYRHPVSGKCSCVSGYYGDSCELRFDQAHIIGNYTIQIVRTLAICSTDIWNIIYLISRYRSGQSIANLGTVSILLNIVSSIGELITSWIGAPLSSDLVSLVSFLTFFYISILLLFSASAFIVGHWVDVLGAKRFDFSNRRVTKVVIIINAIAGIIMAYLGGYLGLNTKMSLLSIVLIVFPLVSTVVLVAVLSAMVIMIKPKFLTGGNLKKKQRATRVAIALLVFLITFLGTLAAQLVFSGVGFAQYSIILDAIFMICRRGISIALIVYFDPLGRTTLAFINSRSLTNSERTVSTTTTLSKNTTKASKNSIS